MSSILKNAVRFGCLLALFSTIFWVAPVQAQGGFAMSGSFYSKQLELPLGASIRTPDIYVVVFNNSSDPINVKMTTNVPQGVTLVLSESSFPLGANSQKKIDIGIDIAMEAVPGDYQISVTAQPFKEGVEGIQIVGGASQEADLTITGDVGIVDISTVSADGTQVPSQITLFRTYEQGSFEVARTETGSLVTNVAPGRYVAHAYVAGRELAIESFTVAANEQKTLNLTLTTVSFEGFEIVPLNQSDTGKLVMVRVVGTVKNLLDAFEAVKVNLSVNSDTQTENVNIINLSRLEKGDLELNNNYVPADGWRQGVYVFKLELEVGGQIYTTSNAKTLKVDEMGIASLVSMNGDTATTTTPASTAQTESESGNSDMWLIIAGAVVGVLLIVTVIFLVRRRRY